MGSGQSIERNSRLWKEATVFENELMKDYYDDCGANSSSNYSRVDSAPFSIFYLEDGRTATDLDKEQANFMWKTLMIDCLIRMQYKPYDEKQDLVSMLKRNNTDVPKNLADIEDFDTTYERNQAILWYKKESCIYQTLNNALRKSCINTIFTYRFYIRDLTNQLAEEKKNFVPGDGNIIYLYRGQRSPEAEVKRFQESMSGSLIAVDSFFSTSKRVDVALKFMNNKAGPKAKLLPVFFEIECDLSLNTKPFADISSPRLGAHSEEYEVLFMVGTIFQFDGISYDKSKECWNVKLSLVDEKRQTHIMKLYHSIQRSMGEETDILTLGALLKTAGDYEHALRFYAYALWDLLRKQDSASPDDERLVIRICREIAAIECELGRYDLSIDMFDFVIKAFKQGWNGDESKIDLAEAYYQKSLPLSERGDYIQALKHCHQALKIWMKYANGDAYLSLSCYQMMGNIHGNISRSKAIKNDQRGRLKHFTTAFDFYIKGLNILKEIHKDVPDHPDIGSLYVDIGQLYRDIGESDKALNYTVKALDSFRKGLPTNHQWIGIALDNMGEIYVQQRKFDEALNFFNQALDVYRKTLPDDHRFIGETYHNIGKLYCCIHNDQMALNYFLKADKIYRTKIPQYHYLATELHQQIDFVKGRASGIYC